MKLRENLIKISHGLLDLVFPMTCLVCGAEQTYLCAKCQATLPRLKDQKCAVCYQASPFGKTHPNCVSKNVVDGSIAALSYQDKRVEKIIETFKYNFVSDLAQPLAQMIVEAINQQELFDYFEDFTIIPVPLHPRRYNWRGFNQAELLIQALTTQLQISSDFKMVTRNRFTQPQVRLTAEERKRNLENAFAVIGNPINKKILIVDDVVTSGSTVNELAKILKRAGAAEVWALSAAHG